MERFLKDIEMEELRRVIKTSEWKILREQALSAWNNRCSNKMVTSPDESVEKMGLYASELKYGTQGILWFFATFLPELTEEVDKGKE